jgi:hypothetical protein
MLAAPITPLALGTYGALSLARFTVVNKDRIKTGFQKAKDVVKDYWKKMSDEFHADEPRNIRTEALQ